MITKTDELHELAENTNKLDTDYSIDSFSGYRFDDIVVVVGDTTDPVKNLENIQVNKKVQLGILETEEDDHNQLTIELIGTIIPKTEKDVENIKHCFLKDGKLANIARINIEKGSTVVLHDAPIPEWTYVTGQSKVEVYDGATMFNCDIDRNSDLKLAKGSRVAGLNAEHLVTGSFKNSTTTNAIYAKDDAFSHKPIKLISGYGMGSRNATDGAPIDSTLNDVYLSGTVRLEWAKLSNTFVANSTITRVYTSAAKPEEEKFESDCCSLIAIIASDIYDSALGFNTSYKEPSTIKIMFSELNRVQVATHRDNLSIYDSAVSNTILISDPMDTHTKGRANQIRNSNINGLITDKRFDIKNSKIFASLRKGLVVNHEMDAEDVTFFISGGLAIPNVDDKIKLSKFSHKPKEEDLQFEPEYKLSDFFDYILVDNLITIDTETNTLHSIDTATNVFTEELVEKFTTVLNKAGK